MFRTMTFAVIAFLTAAPVAAITIPADDFVVARTKTVTAEYIQDGPFRTLPTDEDLVVEDSGFSGEPVSATLVPSAQYVLGPSDGGLPPYISPGVTATSGITGFTHASVSGELNDSTADAHHTLRATVIETIETDMTSIIGGGGSVDLHYSFVLQDMFIEIWDNTGDPDAFIRGDITYDIFIDDEIVWGFGAGLQGNRGSSFAYSAGVFDYFSDVGYPVDVMLSGDPGTAPRRLDVGALVFDDLHIGTFGDIGDAPVISVVMTAEVTFEPFALGAGARASIGDPNALSTNIGSFTLETRDDPGVIPLPASLWLLVSGFGVLAFWRRSQAA